MHLRRICLSLVVISTLMFVYGTASAQAPDVSTQLQGMALRAD